MNDLKEFLTFIAECKENSVPETSLVDELFKNKIIESPFNVKDSVQNYNEPAIEKIEIEPEIPVESGILIEPESETRNLIEQSVSIIKKDTKLEKPQQISDIKILENKIKSIEKWLSNIPLAGDSGGGAGSIIDIDYPVRSVSGNTNIGRKDYYVGVNSNDKTYITLPSTSKQGRVITIKDESGHCSLAPIVIQGTIDNDPYGVELRVNNGSLTLIYNNGWRLI